MQRDDSNGGTGDGTLGRIALKQVRVSRAEVQKREREREQAGRKVSSANRLVPYLDLFSRLSDEELSRLARVPLSTVDGLRQQVDDVGRALGRYVDLLPRLSDDELARLSGAAVKTIRFWRLSQPRHMQGEARPRDVAAQTLPRRDAGSDQSSGNYRRLDERRLDEDSSESSSSSGERRRTAEYDSPADSSTFVIETVEE